MATKAAATEKENVTEGAPEIAPETKQSNRVVFKGAALLKLDGFEYTHGAEFELTDEQLQRKGVRHLFVAKQLEFLDDSKRTREFVKSIKVKSDPNAGKTREELETGAEFK